MGGDNDGWVKILMWIGVGFAVAWIFIPKQTAQSVGSTSCTARQVETDTSPLFGWKPLREIPSVNRLDQYKPIPIEEDINSVSSGTRYKNSEKWKVKRDPDTGRIIGYEVDRNADIK